MKTWPKKKIRFFASSALTGKPGRSAFTSDIVRITAPTAMAGMLMIVTTVLATTAGGGGASACSFRTPAASPSALAEAAVLAQDRAPGVEEEQQEPDADQQHADEIARGRARRPTRLTTCAGSGNRNVHAAANPPTKMAPSTSTTPSRKHTRFASRMPRLRRHVAREEVPHHAGAAEAGDRDHADAVRGEQLIEAVRRNGDEAGLRCAHEQAEHHEQREHDRGDPQVRRDESAARRMAGAAAVRRRLRGRLNRTMSSLSCVDPPTVRR